MSAVDVAAFSAASAAAATTVATLAVEFFRPAIAAAAGANASTIVRSPGLAPPRSPTAVTARWKACAQSPRPGDGGRLRAARNSAVA